MSELRKANTDSCYFVTLTLVGWIDLFSRERYKEIVVENLAYCQKNEGLEIFGYVIMTNHLHIICRKADGNLTNLLGRFKSYTAKEFLKFISNTTLESRSEWLMLLFSKFATINKQYSKYHIWQYTSHPIELYNPKTLQQKLKYIHNNPVKSGIVTEASAYKYSSACFDSPLKVISI
jgi:REP element-mobilizing transposase RayT